MKIKILFILTFFVLTNFVNAQMGSNRLSHNQYMVTYTGAEFGDIVGLFDSWYPTADTTTNPVYYSLINNENDIYAINTVTGSVTIFNNNSLSAGIDTIIVQTSLGGITENDTIFVTVKTTALCNFYDFSAETNGTGTRASPHNTWTGTTLGADSSYLFKRGTTNTVPIVTTVSGTLGQEIIFGAYGTGARPIITVSWTHGVVIRSSYLSFFEINFIDGGNEGVRLDRGDYHDIILSDMVFDGNQGSNGQISLYSYGDQNEYQHNIKMLDVIADNGAEFGIKSEVGGVRLENIRTSNNAKQGVSLATESNHCTVIGLHSYGNQHDHAIEASGGFNDISYSILDGTLSNDAISMEDATSEVTRIHHCKIFGGTYSNTINIPTGFGDPVGGAARNFIIEDNEIYGNTAGAAGIGVRYLTDSVVIRRNKIYDCPYGIRITAATVDSVWITDNIFHDNTVNIYGQAGERIWIYNNTIIGSYANICDINLDGTTIDTVRNNYIDSLRGQTYQSNNIDIDTITTANHFTNFTGHDFHLKSSATSAIDGAYDWDRESDYDGHAKYGSLWDIGAFEYFVPTIRTLVPYLAGTERKFFLSKTSPKEIELLKK